MTTEQVEQDDPTMVVGDLSAGYLRACVDYDDDDPYLRIDDGEYVVHIDAAFGTLEQAILGLERLISAANEYRDILRRAAVRRAG